MVVMASTALTTTVASSSAVELHLNQNNFHNQNHSQPNSLNSNFPVPLPLATDVRRTSSAIISSIIDLPMVPLNSETPVGAMPQRPTSSPRHSSSHQYGRMAQTRKISSGNQEGPGFSGNMGENNLIVRKQRDKSCSIALTLDKSIMFAPPMRSAPHSPIGFRLPSLAPEKCVGRRLNSSFTSPSIVNVVAAKSRRSSRPITYGYASLYPFRDEYDEEQWCDEYYDELPPATPAAIHPCTSSEEIIEGYRTTPTPSNCSDTSQFMTLFFLRFPDQRVMPVYCHQPIGAQADQFIQSLSERQKELLRKFLAKEKPEEGECYVWIREDPIQKTTVVSLKMLENHFKNEHIRRVKWRHLSIDKASVYRYSLPVITSKFRLRVAHFFSMNYRCCILCVWCLVILVIAAGIVLSILFGSTSGDQLRTLNIPGGASPLSGGGNVSSPAPFRIPLGSLSINGAGPPDPGGPTQIGLQGGPVLYTETEQWSWKHERRKKHKLPGNSRQHFF